MKRIVASLLITIALTASAQTPATAARAESTRWLKALCAMIPSAAVLAVTGAGLTNKKQTI